MISLEDKQAAVDSYVRYSSLTSEELDRFYTDLDFLDLCNVRELLDELHEDDLLSDEQLMEVLQADQRLTNAFTTSTLEKYADYFPTMPIRDWWG